MRRILKRLCFGLIFLLLLLAMSAGALLVYSSQSPINLANFNRVQIGMPESRLRSIFGEPTLQLEVGSTQKSIVWLDVAGVVNVTVTGDGKVADKSFTPRSAKQQLRWMADAWRESIGFGQD